MGHRQKREYLAELDARLRLLEGFPKRGLRDGLAELHEPGGKRPQSMTGLDRTLAQEDAVFPFGDRADHHERIAVVNGPAVVAYVARERIAGWHSQRQLGAALGAKIQRRERHARAYDTGAGAAPGARQGS